MKFIITFFFTVLLYLPNLCGQVLENITAAYAMDLTGNGVGLSRFNLFRNDSIKVIIPSYWDIKATAVRGDSWFGVRNTFPYLPNELVLFDTVAHNVNFITQLNIPTFQTVSGMAWDNSTSSMFVATYSVNATPKVARLYTIDLETGDSKFIGEIGNYAVTDIAVSKEGILYGVEHTFNNLLKIDKRTGIGSVIGFLGSKTSLPVGLQFNKVTGELYLITYQNSGTFYGAEIKIVNVKTGLATLIYTFPGAMHLLLDALYINTDAGLLQHFNINYPATDQIISSTENSHDLFLCSWDSSRAKATYNFVFGSPTIAEKKFEVKFYSNNSDLTLGSLDSILTSLGLQQGDSITGEWDIWAYRNNWSYDSLKSSNGPRAITFKRAIPQLLPFSLVTPSNNSSITTVFHNATSKIEYKWNSSGTGVKYKWKYFNSSSNPLFTFISGNNGYDTTVTFRNSYLDTLLSSVDLIRGDSINGKWEVWAYRLSDSLRCLSYFNLTFKRKPYPEVLLSFDTLRTMGKLARDSVIKFLTFMNKDYDLFMHGSFYSSTTMSFRDYKTIIWLGAVDNLFSLKQKDSLKAFLDYGKINKHNLVIFSSFIASTLTGISNSYLLDTTFCHRYLGIKFLGSTDYIGGQQVIGDYINNGIPDSLNVNYIDMIKGSWVKPTYRLYNFEKYPGNDTASAIGYKAQEWNTAIFCIDLPYFIPSYESPPGSSTFRILSGAFNFVEGITPVELTSFNVSVSGDVVELNWATATEINNRGFYIERRLPNQDFQEIGFVKGAGSTTIPQSYTFTDDTKVNGFLIYRLKQIDYDGTFEYSKEANILLNNSPLQYCLEQNYPNPFNPSTEIRYSIPYSSFISLKIYDILGKEVRTLVNEIKQPGNYIITFDANTLASGIYFYKIEANVFTQIKKMILLR